MCIGGDLWASRGFQRRGLWYIWRNRHSATGDEKGEKGKQKTY